MGLPVGFRGFLPGSFEGIDKPGTGAGGGTVGGPPSGGGLPPAPAGGGEPADIGCGERAAAACLGTAAVRSPGAGATAAGTSVGRGGGAPISAAPEEECTDRKTSAQSEPWDIVFVLYYIASIYCLSVHHCIAYHCKYHFLPNLKEILADI